MSDACCGPDTATENGVDSGPTRVWQVRELQFAGVAAVLLATAC